MFITFDTLTSLNAVNGKLLQNAQLLVMVRLFFDLKLCC